MELNIIEQVLKLLKIRHTHFYTSLYYETYPEHNNLYGLSRILSQYNIKSTALKLNRPIDICKLNVPFIAYAEHNFVIVKRIHSNKVTYIINSIEKINSIDEFIKICSGIVLILEKTSKSVEPNYIEHLKNTILYNLSKTFLICFGLIISYYIYKTNNIDSNNLSYSLLMLLINILGIYVCYLIYCNYHHLKNSQMNRICSMIKKSNCKTIFNSENIFHLIDLSEIGLSYFITNLIIILLIPSFYNNLSFINLLTLPFSLWSFYYQKYRAKNWCTLCIVSQIILWIIFLLNILFNKISLYMWNFKDIIFTIFLWISILSFIIIFISPLITIFNKLKINTYKLNA